MSSSPVFAASVSLEALERALAYALYFTEKTATLPELRCVSIGTLSGDVLVRNHLMVRGYSAYCGVSVEIPAQLEWDPSLPEELGGRCWLSREIAQDILDVLKHYRKEGADTCRISVCDRTKEGLALSFLSSAVEGQEFGTYQYDLEEVDADFENVLFLFPNNPEYAREFRFDLQSFVSALESVTLELFRGYNSFDYVSNYIHVAIDNSGCSFAATDGKVLAIDGFDFAEEIPFAGTFYRRMAEFLTKFKPQHSGSVKLTFGKGNRFFAIELEQSRISIHGYDYTDYKYPSYQQIVEKEIHGYIEIDLKSTAKFIETLKTKGWQYGEVKLTWSYDDQARAFTVSTDKTSKRILAVAHGEFYKKFAFNPYFLYVIFKGLLKQKYEKAYICSTDVYEVFFVTPYAPDEHGKVPKRPFYAVAPMKLDDNG